MLLTCKIKVHVFEKKNHRISQRAPPPTKNYTRFMDRFTVYAFPHTLFLTISEI